MYNVSLSLFLSLSLILIDIFFWHFLSSSPLFLLCFTRVGAKTSHSAINKCESQIAQIAASGGARKAGCQWSAWSRERSNMGTLVTGRGPSNLLPGCWEHWICSTRLPPKEALSSLLWPKLLLHPDDQEGYSSHTQPLCEFCIPVVHSKEENESQLDTFNTGLLRNRWVWT
jgi:hypothetical protein